MPSAAPKPPKPLAVLLLAPFLILLTTGFFGWSLGGSGSLPDEALERPMPTSPAMTPREKAVWRAAELNRRAEAHQP